MRQELSATCGTLTRVCKPSELLSELVVDVGSTFHTSKCDKNLSQATWHQLRGGRRGGVSLVQAAASGGLTHQLMAEQTADSVQAVAASGGRLHRVVSRRQTLRRRQRPLVDLRTGPAFHIAS